MENRYFRKAGLIITAVCLLLFVSQFIIAVPQQLKVSGVNLQTVSTGCTMRLVGVNVDGLEWAASGIGPAAGFGGNITLSIAEAVSGWKANCVRIPLNQDWWFGYTNADMYESSTTQNTTYMNNYRAIVDSAIATASAMGCYVELDLHWSGTGSWGSAKTAAQKSMPDAHSTDFWASVAARYANNPAVIFNLYNEPYTTSWSMWKSGGTTTEGFTTPGFQALVKTVRDTGAKNIISIGGLGYAWDMTGISSYAITDQNTANTFTGYGIMYEAHIYDNKGGTTEAEKIALWNTNVTAAVTSGYCIMIGEFGPATTANSDANSTGTQDAGGCTPFDTDLISWINGSNTASHVYNAMAWDFNITACPCLLTDWTSFTPSTCHGAAVKAWLAAVIPSNCPAGTSTFTQTQTATPDFTRTYTPSFTRTSTSTYTPLKTATATYTETDTPAMTYTSTALKTSTYTATATSTAANTYTATKTTTLTYTATFTASVTATNIITDTSTTTSTATPGSTSTYTATSTATYTPDPLQTRTFTATVTATPTYTSTGSGTATYTGTITDTATPGDTQSFTATPTFTATPEDTWTDTSTCTATFTGTATHTLTLTLTYTATGSVTASSTETKTPTKIPPTATMTWNASQTQSPTATCTFTKTPAAGFTFTQTYTETAGTAEISTYTPTAQLAQAVLKIVIVNIYPQPYDPDRGDLRILFNAGKNIISAEFDLYTSGYRLVRKVTDNEFKYSGENTLTVSAGRLKGLASGTYYFTLRGTADDGAAAMSKPETVIIIK